MRPTARYGNCARAITAAPSRAAAARAPAFVISTGTYWRNAWKYRDRTYRHFGWDNGTILANLLAMASALGIPARLMCAFVDAEINRLLDLDEHREVALSVVALGENGEPPPAPEIAPLGLETAPLSPRVLDFPLMREVHRASSLATLDEVIAWRAESTAAAPLPKLGGDGVEDVIERRGSARRFDRAPIGLDQLSTMLDRATRGIPADFDGPLNELYLIVHVVDGLPPGAYHYRPAERALDLLKHGEFRRQAAYLALEQDLAGDAAAAVFFLADLDRWLGRFSNRGYRAVQLEAGIAGGKLYLGAYAQRLGATGLTFYDDEVVEFFSPHAAGKSAIFLVAVGRPLRRATAL